MANITDQFVTSFSELHINAATVSTNIAVADVRNFFTGGTDSAVALDIVAGGTVAIAAVVEVTDTTGTKLFFANNTTSIVTVAASTTLTTLDGQLTFVGAQVPLVMEIGTLSNEATVIDTPTFGELYRGKLRGQLDGGQLDSQLYWAPQNFVHEFLRGLAEDGNSLSVGIKWNRTASGTDSEYVVFNSFVSSFGIDTTFDDVAKVSSTFVVDGAEHFASDE